jgi:hypothetical protein
VDEKLAGQIVLRKHWNLFAWVTILPSIPFPQAGRWAGANGAGSRLGESRGLPGIMLETQDICVAACRFYERYGFELGGSDRLLYKPSRLKRMKSPYSGTCCSELEPETTALQEVLCLFPRHRRRNHFTEGCRIR